jgi:hypothetical protein
MDRARRPDARGGLRGPAVREPRSRGRQPRERSSAHRARSGIP